MAIVYSTWSPTDKSAGITLSNGNLTYSTTSAIWEQVRSTIGVSTGKWYWENTITAIGSGQFVGIGTISTNITSGIYVGTDATSYSYFASTGQKVNNNTFTAYGATWTTGDIIGVALDMDGGTITLYKNNTSQGTMFTGLTGSIYPIDSIIGGTGPTTTTNFGATAFSYTPPTGYNAGLYTGSNNTTGALAFF